MPLQRSRAGMGRVLRADRSGRTARSAGRLACHEPTSGIAALPLLPPRPYVRGLGAGLGVRSGGGQRAHATFTGRASMTSIAFIGVGNMGGPMARNLLKA